MLPASNVVVSFDDIKKNAVGSSFSNIIPPIYTEKNIHIKMGYNFDLRFSQEELFAQREKYALLAELLAYNFKSIFAEAADDIPLCMTDPVNGCILYSSDPETEGLHCGIVSGKNRYLVHELDEGRPLLLNLYDNETNRNEDINFGKIISYPIFDADKQMCAVLMFGSYSAMYPFDEIMRLKIGYCCRAIQEQFLQSYRQRVQLKEIIDAIPNEVIVLNEKLNITQVNNNVLDFLGISPSLVKTLKLRSESIPDIARMDLLDSFIIDSPSQSVKCEVISCQKIQCEAFSQTLLVVALERLEEAASVATNQSCSAMDSIICRSPEIKKLKSLAKKIAPRSTTVLISGESGTGKELFAHAIHEASGREGPMLSINCATCNKDMLESELFGYEGGAYTGSRRSGKKGLIELASNGTLFLDEIGELPPPMQASLLRVLQDKCVTAIGSTSSKKVNTRFIAATNKDLRQMVEDHAFREDLYYRIAVILLNIPPLRARPEDVPALVRGLLSELCAEHNISYPPITDEAISVLKMNPWKGNVRELRNKLELILLTNDCKAITAKTVLNYTEIPTFSEYTDDSDYKAAVEHQKTFDALQLSGNNKTAAAKMLGISRKTLYQRMKKYGIVTDIQ